MTEQDLLQHLISACTNITYIRGLGWYEKQTDGFMVQLPDDYVKSELLDLHFKDADSLYSTTSLSYKNICAAEKLLMLRTAVNISTMSPFFFLNQETSGTPHLTKIMLSIEEQETTRCQEWVTRVYPQNPDLLRQLGGYVLFSPDNRFQKIFLITGTGANGKGTFLRILTTILEQHVSGEKLASAVDLDDFGKHERLSIFGKQLIYDPDISGTNKSLRWLKIISGGDKITARALYKDQITFQPTCKILLLSNPIPAWESSPAILRRLVLLQFRQKFEIDPTFEYSLLTDKMLNQWVWYFYQGYQDLCQQGFTLISENNASEYLSQADDISLFLQECCELNTAASLPSETLYAGFEYYWKWILREKKPTPNSRVLGKRLREYGVEKRRNVTLTHDDVMHYGLKPTVTDDKKRWDMYQGIELDEDIMKKIHGKPTHPPE